MAILYTAHASATGGRDGRAKSDDGVLDLQLVVPKELGGPGGPGANPEMLFAAGHSACFLGAMKFVAGKQGLKVPADAKVAADVGIGPRDDGTGFGIAVTLHVSLPGMDKATAEKLVADADIVCPYSHATRGNIPHDLKVTV
jgi:osmotically inducible protein OsmC